MPPEADEAFIDGVPAGVVLHRALRADVDFRFVALAPADSPIDKLPYTAHTGVYEAVHEDGTPDGAQGVTLISPFEVSAADDERFLTVWGEARDLLAAQPGYLGTRLHRSLGPAEFRFVDIARWSSPLAFSRAGGQAAALPFRSHPALYLMV